MTGAVQHIAWGRGVESVESLELVRCLREPYRSLVLTGGRR